MSNTYNLLLKDTLEKFGDTLTEEEIKDILQPLENEKDSPISTGKRLVIKRVIIRGKKINGQIINFDKEFNESLNMVIAGNFKGKSSLFKVIQLALTGNDKLKKDVKSWMNYIILYFKVNDRIYKITLDLTKATLHGTLYKIDEINLECDSHKNNIIFEVKGRDNYASKIQEFFFAQFSYYSLKWTQKNSSKDKNELIEANTSWKTYFKSIYLESKDSMELSYGNQIKKIYQILLGLRYTEALNRITILKEKLLFEKGLLITTKKEDFAKMVKELKQQIRIIDNEIESKYKEMGLGENNEQVISEYSKLEGIVNEQRDKILRLNLETNNTLCELGEIENIFSYYNKNKIIIKEEIRKVTRQINDLNEYKDSKIFFSNLEIKHCPACNHSVKEVNQSSQSCPLCHEQIEKTSQNESEMYQEKVSKMEKLKAELQIKYKKINSQWDELLENKKRLESKIIEQDVSRKEYQRQQAVNDALNNIDTNVHSVRERIENNYNSLKKLIEEKIKLQLRISQMVAEEKEINKEEKLLAKIELTEYIIEKMINAQYKESKRILDDLCKLMLQELHEFGLNSITEIIITPEFDIYYMQNNEKVKFKDIAEGEQLRAKLAFYLSIIQLDIDKSFGRHCKFLIIDSPNKEEGDSHYLDGLKSVLTSIEKRYGNQLQIIIGTATRELQGTVKYEKIVEEGGYVF